MGLSAELRLVGVRPYGWDLTLLLSNSSGVDLLIDYHDFDQLLIVEREKGIRGDWMYPPILSGSRDFTEVIRRKSRQEFEFPVIRESLVEVSPGLTMRRPCLSLTGSRFSAWYRMRFAEGFNHPESLRQFSFRFEEARDLSATAWYGELTSNRVDFEV